MWAAVHHHLETSGLCAGGGLLVDHAELHPHRFRADQDRLVDRIVDGVRSTKDVDDIDRNPDLRSSLQTNSPSTCSPVICGFTGSTR